MNAKKVFSGLFIVSALMLSLPVAAKQSIIVTNESYAFQPVSWYLNTVQGGFNLLNQTTKTQFIQVVVDEGSIGVFKLVNGELSCNESLSGHSPIRSSVCELAPGETLHIDLDYEPGTAAWGTYQIEMG